jgi:hypothetical protein
MHRHLGHGPSTTMGIYIYTYCGLTYQVSGLYTPLTNASAEPIPQPPSSISGISLYNTIQKPRQPTLSGFCSRPRQPPPLPVPQSLRSPRRASPKLPRPYLAGRRVFAFALAAGRVELGAGGSWSRCRSSKLHSSPAQLLLSSLSNTRPSSHALSLFC